MYRQSDVLYFWFGSESDAAAVAREKSELWWKKRDETDALCRRLFQPLVEAAATGALDEWRASAHGVLALILLTDQLPRNIYRGSARAFAFDAQAQQLCLQGLAHRFDRALRTIERVFFYLPLEHAESVELQQRSVELFEDLADSAPETTRKLYDGYLDYARRHRDIVERFGRFPHRNAPLGRESTVEELQFLALPGSSF